MLMKLKPATSKGTYMRSVTISTTHGPGIKIDTAAYAGGAAD
jgi:large subunit ribosomal protein L1